MYHKSKKVLGLVQFNLEGVLM